MMRVTYGQPYWARRVIRILVYSTSSVMPSLLGFWLLSSSWHVLYQAQRAHTLAITGTHAYIRHPQYVAFTFIMFGFLLQWPTILTLLMFPLLMFMYGHLAIVEEREMQAEFGDSYQSYIAKTPRFLPNLSSRTA